MAAEQQKTRTWPRSKRVPPERHEGSRSRQGPRGAVFQSWDLLYRLLSIRLALKTCSYAQPQGAFLSTQVGTQQQSSLYPGVNNGLSPRQEWKERSTWRRTNAAPWLHARGNQPSMERHRSHKENGLSPAQEHWHQSPAPRQVTKLRSKTYRSPKDSRKDKFRRKKPPDVSSFTDSSVVSATGRAL